MLEDRQDSAREAFDEARKGYQKPKRKHPSPISLRLTSDERAQLEHDAGDMTLSRYIRFRLFGDNVEPWPYRRPKRKTNTPSIDHVILGQLLGALGKSRLSSNLNQIAKAANMGALPITPDLETELRDACTDIAVMRDELMRAMGKAV